LKEWPDFLKKKEILFSPKTTREEAIAWGDRYFEAQRLHDAAAFYRRAQHEEGMAKIREIAIETGDLQLFEETLLEGEREEVTEELRRLVRRAEELGRWSDARRAYERLGDEVGKKRAWEALSRLLAGESHRGPGGQSQPQTL
jgi:hypothetical protein